MDASPTGQYQFLVDNNLTTGSCFSSPHHGKPSTPENESLPYFTHISGHQGTVGARSSSLSSGRGSSEGVGSRSGSGSGGAVSRSSSSGHGGAGVSSLIAPATTGAGEVSNIPIQITATHSVSHSSSASNCSTGSLSAGMETNLVPNHRSIPTNLPAANVCSSHQFCSPVANSPRSVSAGAAHALTSADFSVLPSYSSSHVISQPPLPPLAHGPNSTHIFQPIHANSSLQSVAVDGVRLPGVPKSKMN